MDSPHAVPEASSPLALLPASMLFSTSSARTEVATTTGIRSQARLPGINNHQTRTRSLAGVTATTNAFRTNDPFSVGLGAHCNAAAGTGPTTRSRKRSHMSTAAVASAASAPSRKRNAPRCTSNRKKPPPGAELKEAPPAVASAGIKSDGNDDGADKKPAAVVENCCICMCDVEPNDLAMINSCDHRFCFGCIEKWSERENKCPLCKTRFTKIDRVNKTRKKKGVKGVKNTKKVKQSDQRSDIGNGAALEGLIANLNRNSGNLARIIFGGFEFGNPSTSRAAFSTTRTLNGARAEFVNEDSDDDDDLDSPMAAFMRALHGSSVANGVSMSTTVVRPMTVTAHFSTTTRSFARNLHDSTAGNGADNPLEIDDDSVEEVIEID